MEKFTYNVLYQILEDFHLDDINDQKELQRWLIDLRTLAQTDLDVAHCLHHHHTSKLALSTAKKLPIDHGSKIGCYSAVKPRDTIHFCHNHLQGSKNWISQLDSADYAVIRVKNTDGQKSWIYLDLHDIKHTRSLTAGQDLIGMKMASGWTLHVDPTDRYDLWNQSDVDMTSVLAFNRICFETNALGCALGLRQWIQSLADAQQLDIVEYTRSLDLDLKILEKFWLSSLTLDAHQDTWWNQHSNNYFMAKKIICGLVGIVLQIGHSHIWTIDGEQNKIFRDALVYTSHMWRLHDWLGHNLS